MEPSRDEILFATLESLRPAPSPAFAAELDTRAAAGFPRESASTGGASQPLSRLAVRVRGLNPRRIVFAGGGVALASVLVAAVIVTSSNSGGGRGMVNAPAQETAAGSSSSTGSSDDSYIQAQQALPDVEVVKPASKAAGSAEAGTFSDLNKFHGAEAESLSGTDRLSKQAAPSSGPYASGAHHREVEYAAEMVLGTKPEEVGDAAGKVFDAVHQYGGIVLDSSVRGGSDGNGSAEFELLIPSAKLGDALAAFSGIAEVRSRHETSNDITAPTVTTTELLQDSHARIESLLNELADTETEAERDAVEAKLRGERRRAAVLKSSLTSLQRRANFSHVSLRIESGGADSSSGAGSWDIGDAFHDAGQILAAAAGVAIVGLAILGPIALIALLIWLGNRTWLRQRRERVLG